MRNACAQKLGFSNAELLQETKWETVKMNPRRANPQLPKWIWSHNPETYAYETYDEVVKLINEEAPLEDDQERVPPNYPKGYKYTPWNIEDIMENMRSEDPKPFDLGPGDWS